jgi:hypothetical protein
MAAPAAVGEELVLARPRIDDHRAALGLPAALTTAQAEEAGLSRALRSRLVVDGVPDRSARGSVPVGGGRPGGSGPAGGRANLAEWRRSAWCAPCPGMA